MSVKFAVFYWSNYHPAHNWNWMEPVLQELGLLKIYSIAAPSKQREVRASSMQPVGSLWKAMWSIGCPPCA